MNQLSLAQRLGPILVAVNLIAIAGIFVALFVSPVERQEVLEKAPDFSLETFQGEYVRLEDYRGRPVVLNFWAKWCPYCVTEMPELESMYQEYREEGLAVFGIHRTPTEAVEIGESFARELGVTYPLIKDPFGNVFTYFGRGSNTVPLTVLINRDGFVEEVIIGARYPAELRKLVSTILAP